ncbi:pyrroloquinoline quinone precursor peptide PqqA [Neobacillus cucumis]|uniref:Coenzyme PQQ synthesis protein A n=1 Tax=Neobacillus cucumis TaxID=1740721 RepID=A0A2N5HXT4_9BACI|nr:pyrroloquinoline quinone precursor peptide PqqA [Neobacillus cucumis]
MKGGEHMWLKPEYEIINTSCEVTMYSYIAK